MWLCVSCLSPQQAFLTDVSTLGWNDTVTISVRNADTLALRRLYVVIRSNQTLTDDTLTLRIGVFSPDSIHFEEPFTLRIPRTAKAAPLHREAEIPYRSGVVLADTGMYRFTFTPTRPMRGIEAIGIYITND